MVDIPQTLLQEVDALVREGRFLSRESAVAELVRLGLDELRRRGGGPPARPGTPPTPPPMPPHRRDPGDDRPISVDPTRDIHEI